MAKYSWLTYVGIGLAVIGLGLSITSFIITHEILAIVGVGCLFFGFLMVMLGGLLNERLARRESRIRASQEGPVGSYGNRIEPYPDRGSVTNRAPPEYQTPGPNQRYNPDPNNFSGLSSLSSRNSYADRVQIPRPGLGRSNQDGQAFSYDYSPSNAGSFPEQGGSLIRNQRGSFQGRGGSMNRNQRDNLDYAYGSPPSNNSSIDSYFTRSIDRQSPSLNRPVTRGPNYVGVPNNSNLQRGASGDRGYSGAGGAGYVPRDNGFGTISGRPLMRASPPLGKTNATYSGV